MTKRPKKIAAPTGRAVVEWVGKSPDAMPPPRVRLRIFDRANGICVLSTRKIRAGEKWEPHHIVALADGGENRESNLAPALVAPHKVETARQAKVRKKVRAKRKKHVGIKTPPKRPIESRGFPETEKAQKKRSGKEPVRGMSEIARRYQVVK
jgi:5-methylcytosine-specific restriction protein A